MDLIKKAELDYLLWRLEQERRSIAAATHKRERLNECKPIFLKINALLGNKTKQNDTEC